MLASLFLRASGQGLSIVGFYVKILDLVQCFVWFFFVWGGVGGCISK